MIRLLGAKRSWTSSRLHFLTQGCMASIFGQVRYFLIFGVGAVCCYQEQRKLSSTLGALKSFNQLYESKLLALGELCRMDLSFLIFLAGTVSADIESYLPAGKYRSNVKIKILVKKLLFILCLFYSSFVEEPIS